jgi:hypothetical protein
MLRNVICYKRIPEEVLICSIKLFISRVQVQLGLGGSFSNFNDYVIHIKEAEESYPDKTVNVWWMRLNVVAMIIALIV